MRRGLPHRAHHTRRAERNDAITSARTQPQRSRGVVARAWTKHRPRRRLPRLVPRTQHRRQRGPSPPQRPLEQIRLVTVGLRGVIPGAAGVTAVGTQCGDIRRTGQTPRQPVVRQANRCGRIRMRRFMIGQPSQLGRRDGRDGHHTDSLRPLTGSAQLVDKILRCSGGASIVPQQRISNYRAAAVQAYHAVLLGAPTPPPHRRGRPQHRCWPEAPTTTVGDRPPCRRDEATTRTARSRRYLRRR